MKAATKKRKVLAIFADAGVFAAIRAYLAPSSFEINRVEDGPSALVLAANVGYDLILAHYPLADFSLYDFVRMVHDPTSPCRNTPVLLLTSAAQVEALGRRMGGALVQVLPLDAGDEAFKRVLADLVGVAAREDSRILVQIEGRTGEERVLRVCQTRNLSETGLLLHTSRLLPVGSQVGLTCQLPGDSQPLQARVEVVRHTKPDREGIAGMGVRFVDMEAAARERLRRFLRRRQDTPPAVIPPPAPSAAPQPGQAT